MTCHVTWQDNPLRVTVTLSLVKSLSLNLNGNKGSYGISFIILEIRLINGTP